MNDKAWRNTLNHYEEIILPIIRRKVREDDLEDVMVNCLISVINILRKENFKRVLPKALVYRIVQRRICDYFRNKEKEKRVIQAAIYQAATSPATIEEEQDIEEKWKLLSGRQIEILKLIGCGWSNEKIAKELCITKNTVRVHLKKVYKVLEVSDRISLALYAAKMLSVLQKGGKNVGGGAEDNH